MDSEKTKSPAEDDRDFQDKMKSFFDQNKSLDLDRLITEFKTIYPENKLNSLSQRFTGDDFVFNCGELSEIMDGLWEDQSAQPKTAVVTFDSHDYSCGGKIEVSWEDNKLVLGTVTITKHDGSGVIVDSQSFLEKTKSLIEQLSMILKQKMGFEQEVEEKSSVLLPETWKYLLGKIEAEIEVNRTRLNEIRQNEEKKNSRSSGESDANCN